MLNSYTPFRYQKLKSKCTPGEVVKSVSFRIDSLVWEKFLGICRKDKTNVGEVISRLVSEDCASKFIKEVALNKRKNSFLIGTRIKDEQSNGLENYSLVSDD